MRDFGAPGVKLGHYRLLVFDVRQGWEPLCRFLGKPVPSSPFPRTNSKEEFFELVNAGPQA